MLRWPDYLADPPSDTTSGDVNLHHLFARNSCAVTRRDHESSMAAARAVHVETPLSAIVGRGSASS